MKVTALHPNMTPAHLGYLPEILLDNDPRPMRAQIKERYGYWSPMSGLTLLDGQTLHYPGDPPFEPVAKIELEDGRKEFAYFYEHDIVAIIQPDGTFEAVRMD